VIAEPSSATLGCPAGSPSAAPGAAAAGVDEAPERDRRFDGGVLVVLVPASAVPDSSVVIDAQPN